jgi:multiple sugar transport system substrate-binding protein
MTARSFRIMTSLMLISIQVASCSGEKKEGGGATVLVFKHGKIAGDYAEFKKLLDRFERKNPGVRIKDEILPSSTDEQHQFYVINLEGKSADFDVLSMDVIWVPEFARAGWLRDMSGLLPPKRRGDFFPGPMRAVTYHNRIYAVPWYIDAGLLYYRADLLDKYGLKPPHTWHELVRTARIVMSGERGMYGFVWQGKQYEGLICDTLEFFWSNGGRVLWRGRAAIDSPENVQALSFMRDLIVKYRVSPPLVTTAVEETCRRIFGGGRAVYMRNWPYAFKILERRSSAVRGKVGVSELPAFDGRKPRSALGGWQLGINRYSRHAREAELLIGFLSSPEAQKFLALALGYNPALKSMYRDPDLRLARPFFERLYRIFMSARPRPVSPYYMMITQVMQPEFSAALTGIKSPQEALESASRQIDHLLGVVER